MDAQVFDWLLIGSGPAAYSALKAFDGRTSLAVVTGESAIDVALNQLHPKIRAVSVDRGERPGVAPAFARSKPEEQPLLAAATQHDSLDSCGTRRALAIGIYCS